MRARASFLLEISLSALFGGVYDPKRAEIGISLSRFKDRLRYFTAAGTEYPIHWQRVGFLVL